jgi:hypothetical protein
MCTVSGEVTVTDSLHFVNGKTEEETNVRKNEDEIETKVIFLENDLRV